MSKQIIVAAQPEAAEAGARVLMKGGNAVDAAMTAALVQGVVDRDGHLAGDHLVAGLGIPFDDHPDNDDLRAVLSVQVSAEKTGEKK